MFVPQLEPRSIAGAKTMTNTRSGSNQDHVSRRILSFASWTLVGWIVVGYLSTVPSIDSRLTIAESQPIVRSTVAVFLAVLTLTALVTWVAALWYAFSDTAHHHVPRVLLIAVLVFSNFVGAFFYYFLFVHWQPHRANQDSSRR